MPFTYRRATSGRKASGHRQAAVPARRTLDPEPAQDDQCAEDGTVEPPVVGTASPKLQPCPTQSHLSVKSAQCITLQVFEIVPVLPKPPLPTRAASEIRPPDVRLHMETVAAT